MIEKLKAARQFINENQIDDIQAFILKFQKKYDADFLRLIAEQYISRQKAKHKLPSWYANEHVIFPPPLSVEQASSEITARFKAQVFAQNFGTEKCADLTGGMGLDSWALSKVSEAVIYVEQNQSLTLVAKHNFEVLEQKNIEVLNENSILFAQSNNQSIKNFYIDPHRRDDAKNKVFKIEDCEPNLLTIKNLLPNYMVKFSPMLDIKMALEQLQNISKVYIIALENEVKELLFLSNNSIQTTNPTLFCINFTATDEIQEFEFDYETETNTTVRYANPMRYIYEPNASILKAGGFRSIAGQNSLSKLAPNSHLYTSDKLITNFAGRSFICEDICKFDKKEVLSKLPTPKANISTRNFPMKPEEIKKKLGLQDGGEYYLFATENQDKQKIILICRKAVLA
ncbi:MAG: class I SAM-dependent methyltransferase [Emticicia sp.]|uniref:class I SAM-dependent methyltransferase n=1 Tax=Emticicia sp. TaxID=1930953 RepID=UPI003BA6A41A